MAKSNNKLNKTLSIIGNSIFYLLLLVLLLFSITNISVQSQKDIPNLFGKGFVSILSSSMDGTEPDSFPKGSLAFIDVLDDNGKASVNPGDIVVFFDPTLKIHIIHRVVHVSGDIITTQGDVNAGLYGRFKGDNYNPDMQLESFNRSEIIARYTGSIAGLGDTIQSLRSSDGFLLWVVLPLLILFAFEIVVLVRTILKHNKAKLEQKHEQEKELLKQQLLEELKKQQAEANQK